MLCIQHLTDHSEEAEATVIVGGLSLCSRHGRAVYAQVAGGVSIEEILAGDSD